MNDAKEIKDISTAETIIWTVVMGTIAVSLFLLFVFLFCLAVSLE